MMTLKITTGQGDDYTTGYLPEYLYFQKHYKLTPTDLSKQSALDAAPKAIQQMDFTGNIAQEGNTDKTIFSIIEKPV